ncbi:hypothetical protein SAMN05519103_01802 [Rhizobiales bacterium GAS113]|nr:hypothetical protein SAMN05519103_01802 [Rhizobiales bacterium GAS113]
MIELVLAALVLGAARDARYAAAPGLTAQQPPKDCFGSRAAVHQLGNWYLILSNRLLAPQPSVGRGDSLMRQQQGARRFGAIKQEYEQMP